MSNVYISIVGTQLAAVFNPLSVLINENIAPIDKVVLMATEKSKQYAEYINELLLNDQRLNSIIIEDISSSSDFDELNNPPANHILQKYLDENPDLIIFNMAGGMNFQVSLCAMQMSQNRCSVWAIYPEQEGICLNKFLDGAVKKPKQEFLKANPDFLNTEYILQKHNVKFEIVDKNKNWSDEILKKLGIKVKIPASALKNVKIGNTIYDYIVNKNNTLFFIASLIQEKDMNALESARDIIEAAQGRDIIHNIFHRNFTVFSNNPSQIERLQSYSKINKIIDVSSIFQNNNNPIALSFIKKEIEDIFKKFELKESKTDIKPQQPNKEEYSTDKYKADNQGNSAKVLYVVLGTDILPTAISLYSSEADEAVFLYTPDNKNIETYKNSIIEHKNQFKKLKKFAFYPLNITGEDILDIDVDTKKEMVAVISPGTKSHAYFLTLLGLKNNGKIYSIENHNNILSCLSGNGENLHLKAPDPVMIQKLKGESFQSEGERRQELEKDVNLFRAILAFIKSVVTTPGESIQTIFFEDMRNIPNIPHNEIYRHREIILPDYIYKEHLGKAELSHASDKSKVFRWSLDGGEWFERLIGYVMIQCGAENVRVRMRMAWSEATHNVLKKKYKNSMKDQDIIKDDIDVAVRFKNRYYLISCKATKKDNDKIDSVVNQAEAMSEAFGRFCIPLVCYLKFGGEPVKHNNKLYVFGYNTFTEPDKMKALLETAAIDKKSKRA